jgi:signal transduction histidine kinase
MATAHSDPDRSLLSRRIPLIPAAHGELLKREFRVNVRVRFAVAATLVLGGTVAWLAGGPAASGGPVVMGLGGVVAAYNLVLRALHRRRGGWERETVAEGALLLHYSAVLLDVIVLAAVVFVLGGIRSPFMTVYFLHLTLSCFLYPRRAALAIVAVVLLVIGAQAVVEVAGVVPSRVLVGLAEFTPLDPRVAAETVLAYWGVGIMLALLLIPTARWARKTQLLLEKQRDELAERSRLRKDFLQLAVHNLRSPLAASLMHLENLESGAGGELTDVQRRWLQRMGSRLEALMEMLDGLGTLARTEIARVGELGEPVDVEQIMTDLAYQYEARAEERGLTLLLDFDPETPPVQGIPVLVREAVANYLANAVKYASAPGTVTLRTRPGGEDGWRAVRLEVSDLGPGIPDEHRHRIFTEFARIPHPRATEPGVRGSGLGLSLVKRIAEVHGGRVGVETGDNRPSTFWIELPVWQDPAQVRAEAEARFPESGGAWQPTPASEARP